MEKKFAASMTFNENVFYHRALVSGQDHAKPAKKSFLGDLDIPDVLMSFLAFGLYFLATGEAADLPNRIFQSVIAWILFLTVMRSLNRMRKSSKEPARSESALKRIAKSDLGASGQDGEECNVSFGEDSFMVESPGIISEYKYDGVTRIKETDEFFMIFKSRLTIIPVEKSGIEEGAVDELREFLEEKCGLAVEKAASEVA